MDYTGITCVPVLHKPAIYFMGALRIFLCPCFPAAAASLLPMVQIWVISPMTGPRTAAHMCFGGGEVSWHTLTNMRKSSFAMVRYTHRLTCRKAPCNIWPLYMAPYVCNVLEFQDLIFFCKSLNSQARQVGVRRLGRASRLSVRISWGK